MADDGRTPPPGPAPGRRKATPAERRERRATVEDLGQVLDAAARFLEARPRSTEEVRRKLAGLGYRPTLVDAAIDRLTEMRYLDDEAFAAAWVESRDRARPRGERVLRQELRLKGVDPRLVDEVLDARRSSEAVPEDADTAAAVRLLRRKLGSIARETDPRRRRQRAYALLARSGFPPDVCAAVTRNVLDGTSDGTGEDAVEPA